LPSAAARIPAAPFRRASDGDGNSAPAGLDLGAITPDEIAISILAEIVAVRRGKDARGVALPSA
jgi:hypothetical protein